MLYSIAGHIIETSAEEPGGIPGFSPFLVPQDDSSPVPLVSIRFGRPVTVGKSTLLYHFTIEEGTCEFLKNEDCYIIRWRQTDGSCRLMKVQPQGNSFAVYTDMDKNTNSHILEFSLWIAFGIAALYRQTVSIHASTIVHNGKAILFLGESGTGKSTQSRLWLEHIPSTELLNDDSPFICTYSKDMPAIWGTPWSGKTPCYKNKSAPIAAFVRLYQAPCNTIKRLRIIEAIAALQPSLPPILSVEPAFADLMHTCLSSAIAQIPVYSMGCLPHKDAAQLLYNTLVKDGRL